MKRLLGLALLLLAGCGGQVANPVVIVSPHWEGIKNEFASAFAHWHLERYGEEANVVWVDQGGTSKILEYVRQSYAASPEGIGIDVFFGGGTAPYQELKKDGLLQACLLPETVLARIGKDILGAPVYDPEFFYYGAVIEGFGILYNREVLRRRGLPEPKVWEDLASPRMFGEVALADPGKSGSIHMMVEIILQAYGWRRGWSVLARAGANSRHFTEGSSQLARDVGTGQVACGPAISSYGYSQIEAYGAERVGYAVPADYPVFNADSIALLRGAPHPERAQRFLEFVLSPEGQRLWVLRTNVPGGPREHTLFRLPVLPSLYPEVRGKTPVDYDPFRLKRGFRVNTELVGRRWVIVSDLFNSLIRDAHPELSAAWKKTLVADPDGERLLYLPVDESWVSKTADLGRWEDEMFRSETRAGWVRGARAHYRGLAP